MARQVKEAGQVLTRQRAKVKEPGLWKVLLHNDDYTTQEFVVWLLKTIFRKSEPEATVIMLAVHKAGVGVAGVYTKDVAETRAERGRQLAEREGFPLLLTVEAEDANHKSGAATAKTPRHQELPLHFTLSAGLCGDSVCPFLRMR